MNLIKPYYQIKSVLTPERCLEILQSIEESGRVCYKSEHKITENSYYDFIKMLIKKEHESVLEHEKIKVKFICDRGVSHELVRHRICSFSQESTRYCDYSKDKFDNHVTFIEPLWLKDIKCEWHDFGDYQQERIDSSGIFLEFLSIAEECYFKLLNKGWTSQQARAVLPTALKTEIDVTANLREWRLIFKQRTSKAAHPQMRELMIPLFNELKSKLSPIFDDIEIHD